MIPRGGRVVLLLCLFWGAAGSLFGQLDRPMVRLAFDRQSDFTFSTNLDTWYRLTKGRYSLDLRLNHSNIYNSSREAGRLVQVYVHSDIWQYFKLKKRWDAASWIETDQYINNQNEKISLYGGIRYKPWEFLHITPLIGYTWDTRTAILGRTEPVVELDQGMTPALFVESAHEWADGLKMRTRLVARYKQITPRKQHNLVLDHDWAKEFLEGVTLTAGLHLATHELDDYQGNSVKRILSDTILPHIDLTYEFLPGLEWQSNNGIMLHRRRFLFNNLVLPQAEENDLTFQGMEISTSQRLAWNTERLKISGGYEFQFSTRSYDLSNDVGMNESDFAIAQERERQKDFIKNFQRVDAQMQWQVGARHTLETQVTNQYLQYDTPSETNFDDRDELSWVAMQRWRTAWSKDFQTALALQGNYRHYAFLFKEKSQDNYVQRSLRLNFEFAWDVLERLRLEGEQAIYVTYNVKDFMDFNKTDRSTRNLESSFKATWRPSKRLQVETTFRRKETHQSYLNWAQFTETTLDTNRLLTIEQRYRMYLSKPGSAGQVFLEAGYKHFDQTKRLRSNMVGLDNLLKAISLRQISLQTGPLLAIGLRNRFQSTVDLGCWLQIQVKKNKYEVLDTDQIFGAAAQEASLKLVSVALRPYPTARINYYFGSK